MQTIYLDISNKGVIPCVLAKQSEVGRKFLAVITDNGVPYNIPDNALLSVWYEGDTDAGNYSSINKKSAFNIDGNKVSVELVAQMLLKPGNGELCLSITHGDGGETNTWNIPYCVEYKPGAGSSIPTEYYTALTEAGAVAAQAASDAKIAAGQAQEAVRGYVKADGTVPMTGALNMGGNKVANVANPTDGKDAVNLEFVTALAKVLVPVGYVFQWSPVSNGDVDLSTAEKVKNHFGFGTWEQIKDRFLLSAGDTFAVGTTGGEATHTITEDELPAHKHSLLPRISNPSGDQITTSGYSIILTSDNLVAPNQTANIATVTAGDSGYTGNNKAQNNMPPYVAVYVWKRIA